MRAIPGTAGKWHAVRGRQEDEKEQIKCSDEDLCAANRQGLSPELTTYSPVGHRPGLLGDSATGGGDSVLSCSGKAG